MKHIKTFLHFLALFTVIVSLCFIVERSPVYIGKTYFEANRMYTEAHVVGEHVARFMLKPLTEEAFNDYYNVTEEDIETYRTYYGTLPEQLASIEAQYEEKLTSASEAVQRVLREERDMKMADIERNFRDDDYVRDKIMTLKQEVVAKILAEEQQAREDYFDKYFYYDYEFYDSETMQYATAGHIEQAAAMTYTVEEGDYESYTRQYLIDSYNVKGLRPVTYTVERSFASISGTIIISNQSVAHANFDTEVQMFTLMQKLLYSAMALSVIAGLFVVRHVLRLHRQLYAHNPFVTLMNGIPIDVFVLCVIGLLYVTWSFISSLAYTPGAIANSFVYERVAVYELTKQITWAGVIFIAFVIALYTAYAAIYRMRHYDNGRALWQDTLLYKLIDTIRRAFLKRSIGTKVVLTMLTFILGGVFFGEFARHDEALAPMLVVIICLSAVMYIVLRRIGQFNEIVTYTADVAKGYTPKALTIKGQHILAVHSEHVQTLRQGMRDSLREQQKSERLKTELITNVSHDLRTPLTSIITYTDLLKREDISSEERQQYVAILEQKSNRLKVLIEDLFEVSKMASGDIELQKETIDVSQLLQQAIGEHEEAFKAAQLELRITITEQPIMAYIDGQKWWRMLDNLLINASKYALAHTRVYVHVHVEHDIIFFSIKNIANYELNENATELVERFKRADTARHTEGSGLGLAIAASIVDLHKGEMDVHIDGDLFKVTVRVPRSV